MVIKKQVLDKYRLALEAGQMASTVELSDEEKEDSKDIQLLTTKPFLFVANQTYDLDKKTFAPSVIPDATSASESDPESSPGSQRSWDALARDDKSMIIIDAKIESELAELPDDERKEYLKELGLPESGLDKIIKQAYKTLGLITFITAGPKESKAWTCVKGTKAPQAAGKIHTDF